MCEVVDVSARARAQMHQSERLRHAKGGVVDARARAQLHQSERLRHAHAKDMLSGTASCTKIGSSMVTGWSA